MSGVSAIERRVGRAITGRLSPAGRNARLAVFGYHQVLAEPDPIRRSEPDTSRFASDLDYIGAWFDVLPLSEAVERLEAGTLPARAACITFDDGYLNNLEQAAPILAARGMSATFFVTTAALERGVMWNDLVIDGIAAAGPEPDLSSLDGHVDAPVEGEAPQVLAMRIIDAIKYRPLEERWDIAAALYRDNAGAELPRKMMRAEDLRELAGMGFEIGAHTVNHPILQKLEPDAAREEIEGSIAWISDVLGHAPSSFAYPNGRPGTDFGDVHMTQVREAGCRSAVSTAWGIATRKSDRFAIPRVGPWWRLGTGPLAGLLRAYVKSRLRG